MYQRILSGRKYLAAAVGLAALAAVSFAAFASDAPATALRVEPMTALYIQRPAGGSLRITFMLVNTGTEEITVPTENLDRSFPGVDEETDSLRFVLSFDREMEYDGHRIVPSLSKYAPVTLRPGEAALVQHYEDFSTAIGAAAGLDEAQLKAGHLVIGYRVSPSWAKRFHLWQGETHSAPVMFVKR